MFYIRWLIEHMLRMELEYGHDLDGVIDQLHRIDFRWSIRNDENRAGDVYVMRDKYIRSQYYLEGESFNFTEEVSVLEMLVALVCRMSDLSDHPREYHFIEILENLNIYPQQNAVTNEEDIDLVIESVLDRRYHYDGSGGLFPLGVAHKDQTKVEIWYQMMAYINERYGY